MTVAFTLCNERHKVTDVLLCFKCYNSEKIGAPVVSIPVIAQILGYYCQLHARSSATE